MVGLPESTTYDAGNFAMPGGLRLSPAGSITPLSHRAAVQTLNLLHVMESKALQPNDARM